MSKPIFRDYVGVKQSSESLPGFPTQIINPKIEEFHFILGFASEEKSNGVFKETWDVGSYSPEIVKQMKEKFTNVKVIISIGGSPFNPGVVEDEWTAVESLKGIIKKYKDENGSNLIDGIDINYYDIGSIKFSSYIAKVISTVLKDFHNLIKLVSVAPSQNNTSHYQNLIKLLLVKNVNIDFVNYQFYNNSHPIPKPAGAGDFVRLFKQAVVDFYPAKVLPGFSTDPKGPEGRNNLPWDIFFEGCKNLKNSQVFHGAFIWNANYSANSQPPFTADIQTQRLLTE